MLLRLMTFADLKPGLILLFLFLFQLNALKCQSQQPSGDATKNPSQESKPQVAGSSNWIQPDLKAIRDQIATLLRKQNLDAALLNELDWEGQSDLHFRLIRLLQDVKEVDQAIKLARTHPEKINTDDLLLQQNPNVQLEIAMILVKQNRHDQALEILQQVDSSKLVSPAFRLLYITICHHKQVQIEKAMKSCSVLMPHREELPLRYRRLTESLFNDLSKHEAEPLHTVARLMSDASRRQKLQQHSSKVLAQEEEIVRKLDEIIKKLEQQKKQMAASGSSQSKPSPSNPESNPSNSKPAPSGTKASGEVESKSQDSEGNWGSLSDKQRAIAVKSLVRELPPHFQSLMKAYFQKLAEETK